MTSNDDKLIAQFFDENRQDIMDDGFSNKVMRGLPPSYNVRNRIWIAICGIVGVAIFWLLGGVDSLRTAVWNIIGDMVNVLASLHVSGVSPWVIVLTLLTIGAVSAYNLVLNERHVL